MTKTKNQKQKSSSKSSQSKQSKKRNPRGSKLSVKKGPVHSMHLKAACSITDPFCPAARGAHHPDGRGAGTIPFQVRGQATITVDTAGNALVLFVPGLGRFGWQASVISGSNCVLGSTWFANAGSAFLVNNAEEVRIVSWGVNFKSTLSATNCQGLVHTFVTNNAAVSMTIPQLSNNNLEDKTTTLTAGYATSFISKPVGSAAETFRKFSEATNTMSSFDWTIFGLEIIGGPTGATTTVGYAEIVVNLEFTPTNNATSVVGLAGITPLVKPSNPVAIATSRHVQSSVSSLISGGIESVEKVVTDKASSFLENVLGDGMSLLFGML